MINIPNQNPFVSVCMITFNHEPYIAKAIESVISQETNFLIEIIIGEDCSTDNTRKICKEYENKHPNIIRLLPPSKTLGMMPNFIRSLNACRGKYIAILDGDDYWTDSKKLKEQVYILESDTSLSLSFHEIFIYNEHTKTNSLHCGSLYKTYYDITDIIKGNFIPSCSAIFRRSKLSKINDLLNFKIGDWPLYNILLQDGSKAYFLNKNMATYRFHQNGSFSHKSVIERLLTQRDTLKLLKQEIKKFRTNYNAPIIKFNYAIALEKKKESKKASISAYLWESISIWGGYHGLIYQIRLIVLFFLPTFTMNLKKLKVQNQTSLKN